ncbi:hypothetical protein B0G69_3029 [Paraburkholderia sp. RAU2J]|nr:hypothetical protein B0G69_3029 [Paraburkholderia sp. RAU2J]
MVRRSTLRVREPGTRTVRAVLFQHGGRNAVRDRTGHLPLPSCNGRAAPTNGGW